MKYTIDPDGIVVDVMSIEIGRLQIFGDASNVRNNDQRLDNWNVEPTVVAVYDGNII